MSSISEYLALLTDSEKIITQGGLIVITFIVFAETGIFFCFFFPGDYLLFTAGLLCATGVLNVSIWILVACLFSAAVVGNFLGFFTGKFLGHKLAAMNDSFFYKRQYMDNTRDAFAKYGAKALIVGRFLPVIRTFAPIMAGATGFNFGTFLTMNLIGGALWSFGLTFAGYFLGVQFPEVVNYVHYIIIFFIGFTTIVLIRSLRQVQSDARANRNKLDSEQTKTS